MLLQNCMQELTITDGKICHERKVVICFNIRLMGFVWKSSPEVGKTSLLLPSVKAYLLSFILLYNP